MDRRLELHGKLLEIAPKAYYQKPSSEKMKYPCFVYELSKVKPKHADNRLYKKFTAYTVTYISLSVTDSIIDTMLTGFSYCRFDRKYEADDLHHYVFELFY